MEAVKIPTAEEAKALSSPIATDREREEIARLIQLAIKNGCGSLLLRKSPSNKIIEDLAFLGYNTASVAADDLRFLIWWDEENHLQYRGDFAPRQPDPVKLSNSSSSFHPLWPFR
jgi:hypothetical protein